MKKSNLLLAILILFISVIILGCNNTDDNVNQEDETPTVDIPSVNVEDEKIEVIKSIDSFEIYTSNPKVINLDDYIKYYGSKYSFVVTTEDKGVVSVTLDEKNLTINGLKGGSEKVTVKLNNKTIIFTFLVKDEVKNPVFEDLTVEYSIDEYLSYSLELNPVDSGSYSNFNYSLKEESDYVSVDGNTINFFYLNEGDEKVVVVVSYGSNLSLEFTINIKTTSKAKYKVVNGSFDDGLNGWILDGEFGIVIDKATWWSEELPIYNEGNYFSGYGLNNESYEGETGTLTSSKFILGGNGFITFMLGGAGNDACYVKVIDSNNNVVAIYRNTKFTNFPDGFVLGDAIEDGKGMVGNTVFLANFVKYKADLTSYIGQELQVVVCDYAESGWGLVFFDELNTYNDKDLSDYHLAVNELADYEEVNDLLASKLQSQGDYTRESYEKYVNKFNEIADAVNNIALKQEVINSYCEELKTVTNELELRKIILKDKNSDNLKVIVGSSLMVNLNDYFDENNLSNVSYQVESEYEFEIDNQLLTIITSNLNVSSFSFTIKALYNGVSQQEVMINVAVIEDPRPLITSETLNMNLDLYFVNDQSLDLSSNVENVSNLEITYFVKEDEDFIELSDQFYDVELGSKTLEVKCEYVINDMVEFISYTINLEVIDSTNNRIYNGDFETGNLDGWTVNGPMGAVSSETHYWKNDPEVMEGYLFNLDGNYMFSAYAVDKEMAYGTLESLPFTVGGAGWMTYKIGAAKNTKDVYIQIVEKATGDILASFGNELWADRTDGLKSGCSLIAYKANISELIGKEVFIRVVDNAKDDYGLFFLDSFNTYYDEEPTDFHLANDFGVRGNIYEVTNGGFETGDLTGWRFIENYLYEYDRVINQDVNNNKTTFGKVSNLDGCWPNNVFYNKDGNYLFTGLEGQSFETDPNLEIYRGVLRSNIVVLKENSVITFKLGAAKNNTTGIRVVDVNTMEVIASFYNTEFGKDGKEAYLVEYYYQFANTTSLHCYIEIFDYSSGDWGLVTVDSVVCNAQNVEGKTLAINQIS